MFSDDVLGLKAESVEAGVEPSVLFSAKDLRLGRDAPNGSFTRRSAGPCFCTKRSEFGSDKPGARDYVCMPLSRVRSRIYNLNVSRVRVHAIESPPGVSPIGSLAPTTRKLILIVDDEECMRQIKGDYLGRVGYKIIEAEHGGAGVEATARERPGLILMNYLMPEMDGLTATEIIRLRPELRQIPIVMNSACSKDEMRQAALAAGCVDYVEEPGSSLDFLENIEDYLLVAQTSVCDRAGITD
jgi:CheY-like chemotaxis protein